VLEYVLLFALLAGIAFGLPLPEESVLLLGAYFLATGSHLWTTLLVCVFGIAFSDTIQYLRGRYRWRLFKEFKVGKTFIANAGFFAIFFGRFFISARTVLPFMAGAMRMPRLRFHLASLLSAVLLTALLVIGGSWFYSVLVSVTSYAPALWFALIAVLTGVLVMYGTRSQLQLLKQ
jgi:membrane protein DedA with SNARE-associated domain